jgi:hypothetical protein
MRPQHVIMGLVISLGALFVLGCREKADPLRISWSREMLTIESDRLPGGKVQVWHLEAFCRKGSTDRDWARTVIPHRTELLSANEQRTHIKHRTTVGGVVEVTQDIRSSHDEVGFHLELVNTSSQPVDVEWAQPCIRVHDFTGRKQHDYFQQCFIFTEHGLTRMSETHRESQARYTPGQVYVPPDVDLADVNPRPISMTRPVNGLVGCFSADGRMVLASAWSDVQELFQGIIVCIHSDFRIGGLAPGQRKRLKGRIYIVPNDVQALLRRYERDFDVQWDHLKHDGAPSDASR